MNKKFVPPITGAIFDCDGTLLDSLEAWRGLEAYLAQEAGVEVQPEERAQFATFTIPEVAGYFHNNYGLGVSEQAVIGIINEYMMDYYANRAQLLPGAGALLESLAIGGVRLSVASSSRPDYLNAGLRCSGSYDYFSAVLSVDDVGASKREPAIFKRAAELLGTNSATTWGFDDAVYAIRTLGQAGFPSVGICAEGNPTPRGEFEEAATLTVASLEEVSYEYGSLVVAF